MMIQMNKFMIVASILVIVLLVSAFTLFSRINHIATSRNLGLGPGKKYSQKQVDNNRNPCGPIWLSLTSASSTGNFNEPYAVDTNGTVHYSPNISVDVITKSTENEFYILDESSCHEAIYPTIGKDLHTVYDHGYPIPLADAPSFMPIFDSNGSYSSYFRDKDRIYTYLPEVDDSGKHTGGVIFTSVPYADSRSFQLTTNSNGLYDAFDAHYKYKLGQIVNIL